MAEPDPLEAPARILAYRPAGWKIAATSIALVLAAAMAIGGALVPAEGDDATWNAVAGAFYAAALAIPAVYWLARTRGDARTLKLWAAGGDEPHSWREPAAEPERLRAADPESLPLLPKRRWGVVAALIVAALASAAAAVSQIELSPTGVPL
mgnify:CR=1 FL=1